MKIGSCCVKQRGTILNKKDMEGNGPMAPHKGNMTMMEKNNSSSW